MNYTTVRRRALRGTVHVDGARYHAPGLEMAAGELAEVTVWADGSAQVRVGQDIHALDSVAGEQR